MFGNQKITFIFSCEDLTKFVNLVKTSERQGGGAFKRIESEKGEWKLFFQVGDEEKILIIG